MRAFNLLFDKHIHISGTYIHGRVAPKYVRATQSGMQNA